MADAPETNVLPTIDPKMICGWPDESIDPSLKDYNWHMLCARALYSKWRALSYLTPQRRLDYIENRMYADGNQNTTKYVDKIARLKNQGKKVSYRDLNWGIISTAPKVINAILGFWEKMDYKIMFDCLNPLATEDRRFIEARLRTKKMLMEFNKEMAAMAGVVPPQDLSDLLPDDMDEIQDLLTEGWRLPYEMEMELGVEMVQEENGWKRDLRRRIRREFIVNGVGFMKIWVDRLSQKVRMRSCDVVNGIIEDYYGLDGDASKGIGEVIDYTISECRLEWGDQFTDAEYHKMAESAVGLYGNPQQLGSYSDYVNTDAQNSAYRPWDNYKIRVLDFEIWSDDMLKKEFTNKKGYTEVYNVDPETPKYKKNRTRQKDGTIYTEEVKSISIKTVRGGKWVINTDFLADWGKKADIARPNENKRECYREFKFYRVANKSLLESIMPVLDMLQTAVLNKQNVLARAMPSGFNIEMGAFEKVMLDGKIKSSEELFTISSETGNTVFRLKSTIDDEGRISPIKPLEWIERNVGAAVSAWWEEIYNNIKLIQVISGINEMMDASTPKQDQGLGTAEMALEGAENCLSPLIQGSLDFEEKAAYMVMLKIQVVARNYPLTGYASLGTGFKTLINVGKFESALSYACRAQALPTGQQKQTILQMAQEAVTSNLQTGQGGIDPEDYIWLKNYLDSGGNLKVAYFMLKKFKKRAQDKANADKERAEKANTDRLMMAAQQAEQQKQQTIQIQLQADMALNDHETQNKIVILQKESELGLKLSVVNNGLEKHATTHKIQEEAKVAAIK